MKKTVKKLALSKETVRSLEKVDAEKVLGRWDPSVDYPCRPTLQGGQDGIC